MSYNKKMVKSPKVEKSVEELEKELFIEATKAVKSKKKAAQRRKSAKNKILQVKLLNLSEITTNTKLVNALAQLRQNLLDKPLTVHKDKTKKLLGIVEKLLDVDNQSYFNTQKMFKTHKEEFLKILIEVWLIYYNNGGVENAWIFEPIDKIMFDMDVKKSGKKKCGSGYNRVKSKKGRGSYCRLEFHDYIELSKNRKSKLRMVDKSK